MTCNDVILLKTTAKTLNLFCFYGNYFHSGEPFTEKSTKTENCLVTWNAKIRDLKNSTPMCVFWCVSGA